MVTASGTAPRRRRVAILLLFCGALVVTPFVAEIQNIDFHKAYHPAGKRLLDGEAPLYSYGGFKNLPLVAYLFVPFAAMGERAADAFVVAQLWVYLVAFATCLRFLSRSAREDWLWLALFLSSRAFYSCLRFGQITLLCFLLLVGFAVAYERARPYTAGVLHGLGFAIKLPLGLFFLYFPYRRRYKTLAASLLTCLGVLSISLLYFGVALHREYVQVAIVDNLGATLTGHNNASLAASALRFLRPDRLFDWYMVDVPVPLQLAIAAVVALLLYGFYRVTSSGAMRGQLAQRLELSMVVCLSLSVLPIVWDHYYVFLILAFHFSLQALLHGRTRGRALAWLSAFALCNFPVLAVMRATVGPTDFPLLRAAVPAAPLLGCLTLLALLMAQYRALQADSAQALASSA
ncbi:MAG: glycosyltransferase family 87 protein [Myxococcota bacterium]